VTTRPVPAPPRPGAGGAAPRPVPPGSPPGTAAATRTAGHGVWPAVLPAPRGNDADLWLLRLPEALPARHALDVSVLDATERRRAASFVHAADRTGYAAAHIALRKVLGACLGVPPAAVRLRRDPCPCCGGPHGRPTRLADPPPYFSLAHGGGVVLIGVARVPVGVAAERPPAPSALPAVSGLLGLAERAEVAASAPERRAAVFARLWAGRRALGRARGDGAGTRGAHGWQVTGLPVDALWLAVAIRRAADAPEGRVTLHHLDQRGVFTPSVPPGGSVW
jgi:4'-phosphopantetheinyl transferase